MFHTDLTLNFTNLNLVFTIWPEMKFLHLTSFDDQIQVDLKEFSCDEIVDKTKWNFKVPITTTETFEEFNRVNNIVINNKAPPIHNPSKSGARRPKKQGGPKFIALGDADVLIKELKKKYILLKVCHF